MNTGICVSCTKRNEKGDLVSCTERNGKGDLVSFNSKKECTHCQEKSDEIWVCRTLPNKHFYCRDCCEGGVLSREREKAKKKKSNTGCCGL